MTAVASSSALAFQPMVTDDTGTQGTGGNQVEISYAAQNDTVEGSSDKIRTRGLPLVFTRGMTDDLDLYVGSTRQRITEDSAGATVQEKGWGNIALGAKWRFYEDETAKRSFGLKPEIQLPVSDDQEARGLGTGHTSWSATLIMTQETDFGAIHVNLSTAQVNYSLQNNRDAARRNQHRISVGPVWQVTEQVKLLIDIGIKTNPDVTQDARMGYAQVGAVYSPSQDLDFALGFTRNSHDGSAQTTQGLVGVTWRFK